MKMTGHDLLLTSLSWALLQVREHSFLEAGWAGGIQRRVIDFFACPKREGQHKFDTTKRWVTLNFTASQGRVTFFNTKYKGRAGRFTFTLIGIPLAQPPF